MSVQRYVIEYRPFADPLDNWTVLFNELMASMYLYTLLCLEQVTDDYEIQEKLGWCLLSTILIAFSANLAKALYLIAILIIKRVSKSRRKAQKEPEGPEEKYLEAVE